MSDTLDYPIENFCRNSEAKYVLYTSSLLVDGTKVISHFDIMIFGDDVGSLEAYWGSLPNWDTAMMHVIRIIS